MNDTHKHYIWAIAGLLALAMVLGAYLKSRDSVVQAEQVKQDVQNQISDLKRDLAANLQKIEQDKGAAKTPQQIVERIPQYVTLPQPITLAAPQPMTSSLPGKLPDAPSATKAQDGALYVPAESAKPLFDALAEGKACGLKLDACQKESDLLTQRAKAAEKAMKGGSFFGKIKSNAKWLAIGGALGYVLAKH